MADPKTNKIKVQRKRKRLYETKDPEKKAPKVSSKKTPVKPKPAAVPEPSQQERAEAVVKKFIWVSMGAGLIPVPLVDTGVVMGVSVNMLWHLSKIYNIEFSKTRGKSLAYSLAGSVTADTLRRGALTGFLKSIPFVGILGMVSMPIYSGAMTYALGKIFIQHFESGGTFLDFEPQKVKNHFAALFQEGKGVASNLKRG